MTQTMTHTVLANLDMMIFVLFFAFCILFALMLFPMMRLLDQSTRTLQATENFINTLDKELGPTLQEVDNVLVGVQEIKAIAERSLTDVGTRVDDVTGSLGKAADKAKNQTSVFGTGLMAGIRAYLEGKEHPASGR